MEEIKIDFARKEDRDKYRHSTSHIMAHAVKTLFPRARLGIGPSIDEGFYYDFDVEQPFTPDVLEQIEVRMGEIIAANRPFEREEMTRENALEYFKSLNEPYKVELLKEIDDQLVSIYREGDFVDLCRGPHLANTGQVKSFKLLSVAGSYWRGSEKNKMLQRIYGTSFTSRKELSRYLKRLEEAKKRDHRRLGRELDLFSVHEEAGTGLIYWHPKGARIRELIENFWREEHYRRGYQIVYTPHIFREDLLKISGHLDFYRENMYSPMDIDGIDYYIKPMNCPGHILIYKGHTRSYKDLPIRYAELGTVYRYERSGTLHGMIRVRGFTQDDAHIFCTPEQLPGEILGVVQFADYMMKIFGFDYKLYLATRPDKSIGTNQLWEMAHNGLREALGKFGKEYEVDEGGGVFYGPKIDIKLIDAIGREWQGPTIQLDFNFPEKFDLSYVGPDGQPHQPVMIHRVVLGSMERFMGVLIEHFEGAFPLWCAPVQVRILTVTDEHIQYGRNLKEKLEQHGIRVELDDRNEKMGYKIRESQTQKIPYTLVVGDKEAASDTVAVRKYRKGVSGTVSVEEFLEKIKQEIQNKELLVGGD